MRPLKLTMVNFGPFVGTTEIDFTDLDDIFLITGKTGAGKTTIFDAICYALYGTVPGSRQGHINRLRSDYAEEYQECLVSLEFAIGEKQYQVDRNPKHERPKKRGFGTTGDNENAVIYAILPGEQGGVTKKSLSSKKADADKLIQDLIGLSPEEFFKIVLLPQGEFAEFLRQNTNQRRDVLLKLFPVDFAVRVRELAQKKAREAETLSREAERSLMEISRRVSYETYPELHAKAEEALQKAREEARRLEQENTRLDRILTLEENRKALELRQAQTGEEAAALDAKASSIAEKESRLALSRKAQPLAHHLILETEKREILGVALVELEKVRQDLTQAERKLHEAETAAGELPALEKELAGSREKHPGLVEMAGEEKLLEQKQRELDQITKIAEEGRRNIGALKKSLEEKDRLIAERRSLADQAAAINESLDQERDLKDRLLALRQAAVEAEELGAALDTATDRARGLEAKKGELEKRVPVLREELRLVETEKETGERADMAAHLAVELKPGEPCPVCGSRDHPLSAAAHPRSFGIQERIESLRGSLKDAERDLTARSTELESAKQELAQTQRKLDKLRAGMVSLDTGSDKPLLPAVESDQVRRGLVLDKPFPTAAELGRLLEAKSRELTALAARQKEARTAGDNMAILYREREGLLAKQMEMEKNVSALEEQFRGLEKSVVEMRDKHRGLLEEGKLSNAAEALEALDRSIGDLERRIRERRENLDAAGREAAAARAREEGSAANRSEAEKQHREAAAALKEALASSSFSNAESLRAAILGRDAESALEAGIDQWKVERSRLKTQGEELERSLEEIRTARIPLGPSPAEPEEIQAALKTLATDREKAETGRERVGMELSALEQDAARLKEAGKRREELAQSSGRLSALAADLGGNNPKRKPFDAWLLGLYLKEVAAFATKRLYRMSESRYSLILNSERVAGNALAGLDLAVFDSATGKTRPCATLSGGESFMASISLALGLADSIQARSGGIRLDAVFIDEGFGSLDEGTLDKAMIVLDELREHRMVGLISHVGEMRSRIPSRIEVIKTGSGSRIVVGANLPD
ncbi:nuclease sbcCD subunit C [Treponema primitia ZAS-2]|uniref:Nuclease sbcCD subunit C n=1 Tax=Treponema primitia (strain ATCC BAA-887 / DSM 12427 / ZAS-2) TaxID=545694 RepID=F5YJF5_TREPZ|nr:AAA family ATPase [Treponema primitia]AEF84379.1 nuclease sbcCD subunit C [Treponema primitia ZAS-2]